MESKRRLLRLLVERLPPFITNYQGKHRQYVADFTEILQHLEVTNLNTRKTFIDKAKKYHQEYCDVNTGYGVSDYVELPFLWFVGTLIHDLLDVLEGGDTFNQFLSRCYRILYGPKDALSVFALLKEGVPLTDYRWEDLQYRVFDIRQHLTPEDLALLRLFWGIYPDLKFSTLCLPIVERLLHQKGAFPSQIQAFRKISSRLGVFYFLSVNWRRAGVDEFELVFETPPGTDITEIFAFNSSSILVESRLYTPWPAEADKRTFLGVLRLPMGHENALRRYLLHCRSRGLVKAFQVSKIIERVTCRSLPYEGFRQWTTHEVWRHLEDLMDGEGHPLQSLAELVSDPEFCVVTTSPGPQIPLTYEFAHLRARIAKSAPLGETPPKLLDNERAIIDRLQQEGVVVLDFNVRNLAYEVSMTTHQWLLLPPLPSGQLKTLLQFAPESYVQRSHHGVSVYSNFPPPVAQVFHTPGWAPERKSRIYGVIRAHLPKWITSDALDGVKRRWKPPQVLEDYISEEDTIA